MKEVYKWTNKWKKGEIYNNEIHILSHTNEASLIPMCPRINRQAGKLCKFMKKKRINIRKVEGKLDQIINGYTVQLP